jgi:hypothetical protein
LSCLPVESKLVPIKEGDIMPWDGFCLPGSPLAILLEANRELTAERRAAAKPRRKPLTLWEEQAQRVAQARASIAVLDQLLELLADGASWIQGELENRSGYCLVGGLQHIRRARRGTGDKAGMYLSRAIARLSGERETIVHFNDSRKSYAEIRAVILRARELAQRMIVEYAR